MSYYYNLGTYFEDVSFKYNSKIAIAYKNKVISYSQLNEKSNQIANLLVSKGIIQGDVIAIAHSKRFHSFALMIACLKLGIIYTNIDIDGPEERLEKIFKNCKPKIVFLDDTHHVVKKTCEFMSIEHFVIKDSLLSNIKESKISNMEKIKRVDGNSIAYIMFTSGSTGIPKGAAISHQNLIHFINWSFSIIDVRPDDVFANVNPMYFDNSVFDFFASLFSGSCLAPIDQDIVKNPLLLVNYIDQVKCTIWFSVPSMLRYLFNMKGLNTASFKHIRTLIFGGEGYPKNELVKIYELYKSRIEFYNVYGPTECTCICSVKKIEDNDFIDLLGFPSLGRINQNFSHLILDSNNKETSKGELYLLGPSVGVGYYNDPKRTSKSFFDCKIKKHYGKKIYKTGDLVKKKGKKLYFIGRVDNQIKHMGYRIELEEIEEGINNIEQVEQAAVIYKKEENNNRIVAFITLKEKIKKGLIINKLTKTIPNYMIPNKINILDVLPLNKNGKIDKKRLLDM